MKFLMYSATTMRMGFISIKPEETIASERQNMESGTSCEEGFSSMSTSAAAWIERSVRMEWRPWMFEIQTVPHRGGVADRTWGCGKEQGEGMGQGKVARLWGGGGLKLRGFGEGVKLGRAGT